MRITEVRVHQVCLPFALKFHHALSTAAGAENVVVELRTADGALRSFGEGAPRTYVTGESAAAAAAWVGDVVTQGPFPWRLEKLSQIWHLVDSLAGSGIHNAGLCALEMALLALLGLRQRRNIAAYFPRRPRAARIFYGAPIPLADAAKVHEYCRMARQLGMRRIKLKLDCDLAANRLRLEAVREVLGPACDLKVDANAAWNAAVAMEHLALLSRCGVKVIEQPMPAGAAGIDEFAQALKREGILLMADESACDLAQVQALCRKGDYTMINVRLSKNGGFRNALRVVDYLRRVGVAFQIGCHLGESGLLSAAGRILSLLCPDARYWDGSYDAFLLGENITCENVSFGNGGRADALQGPGLGVAVDPRKLARLAKHTLRLEACAGSPVRFRRRPSPA